MTQEEIKKILEVGVLLSSERDLNRLLERILSCAIELARCDAGTLYLRDGDVLRFKIMRNDTMQVCTGGDGREPDLPPVPLRRGNVCALALLEDRTIRIEDVHNCGDYDFSGPLRYDALTGYHTQSMLVVPMRNRDGEQLGVLQLINALDETGKICAFSPDVVLAVESAASQAAITIQNAHYIQEIRELFHSFVRAMSTAIDERSPYNANHSRRMAACAERLVDYLNARAERGGDDAPFSPQRREELVMSVWLHDVGKVITPLEVMDKAERLLPAQKSAIAHRLQTIRLLARLDCAEGRLTAEELERITGQVREAGEAVDNISKAGFVTDQQLQLLEELRSRTYRDEDGAERPWLERPELAMLSIRKGTLSPEERQVMEEHVVITDKILSRIRFSGELSHVRQWAASHHEFLNGAGYPNRLRAGDIPTEVRIITILDIFDALVADDRPYKPGMPLDRALSVLRTMAGEEGKLDPGLVEVFIASRCWEEKETESEESKP